MRWKGADDSGQIKNSPSLYANDFENNAKTSSKVYCQPACQITDKPNGRHRHNMNTIVGWLHHMSYVESFVFQAGFSTLDCISTACNFCSCFVLVSGCESNCWEKPVHQTLTIHHKCNNHSQFIQYETVDSDHDPAVYWELRYTSTKQWLIDKCTFTMSPQHTHSVAPHLTQKYRKKEQKKRNQSLTPV